MASQSPSAELAERSVAAALAAMEVYNKPTFPYREDGFSILMVNAWELLLKAKHIADHQEDLDSIVVYETAAPVTGQATSRTPKLNRSGNPITHGLTYLAERLHQDKSSGLTKECCSNLLLLVEVRDNAVHFVNKDLHFVRRIQEIGTASLKNYLDLATKWFKLDLTKYDFYLMPLAFFHGFEAVQSVSLSAYNAQMQNLLRYIDRIAQETGEDESSPHMVTLSIETRLVRSKDAGALPIRITADLSAPEVRITEESIRERYPFTYDQLTKMLKKRYTSFIVNNKYHRLRKSFEDNPRYSHVRFLDPGNPRSGQKKFFSPDICVEFDKHYQRK